MSNRSKSKGTAWESAVVAFLRASGFPHAERRALSGSNDCGDVTGIPGVVIEAKSAAKVELAAWADEANVEAANARADLGVVWFHRRGRASAGDGFVLLDGATLVRLLTAAGYGTPPLSPLEQLLPQADPTPTPATPMSKITQPNRST